MKGPRTGENIRSLHCLDETADCAFSLLKAAKEASKRRPTKYRPIVDEILRDHVTATYILPANAATSLIRDLTSECEKLAGVLASLPEAPETRDIAPEAINQVLSVGEKLSARFMTALLEDCGIPSQYVDLSNIHVPEPGTGEEPSKEFYEHLVPIIGRRVKECGQKVPVITGYFGSVPQGLLNKCGRGYSDVLAALVTVGADGRELQVWKEVSGIYTADPRKVPTAKLITSIDPREANELTFYGSEVIHHSTIDLCMPNITIRIKNVNEPEGSGTLIVQKDKKDDPYLSQRQKRPTAITTKQPITIVNIHANRKVDSPNFLKEICATLAKHNMQVDLFELNEMHVSLAVHFRTPLIAEVGGKDQEDTENQHKDFQACIQELRGNGTVETIHNMAIISLIGMQLKRSIGIAGRLFTAFGDNNINIEMISQGASEINISCVISGRDERRAVNVVHTALFTFSD